MILYKNNKYYNPNKEYYDYENKEYREVLENSLENNYFKDINDIFCNIEDNIRAIDILDKFNLVVCK